MNNFRFLLMVLFIPLFLFVLTGCDQSGDENGQKQNAQSTQSNGSSASIIAEERGLSPDDVEAALKTYTPTGKPGLCYRRPFNASPKNDCGIYS